MGFMLHTISLASMAWAAYNHHTLLPVSNHSLDAPPGSEFTYTGSTGPLNWHGLNYPANALCAIGKYQSPINLNNETATFPIDGRLWLDIGEGKNIHFINLGYTLQVPWKNGTLYAPGGEYKMSEFHFHTPSEHRINETHFPLEVHFVFQNANRELVIVGLLAQLNSGMEGNNRVLEVLSHLARLIPMRGNTTDISFDVWEFFTIQAHISTTPFYQYNGSLTTPPCTEGVTWFVSDVPLNLGYESYNRFKEVLRFNSRYTQNTPGEDNLVEVAARSFSVLPPRSADS